MWSASELTARIRRRGLPTVLATIATRGGPSAHPGLEYRAEAVWAPSWSVIEDSGRTDLIPLWCCGTVTMFSAADGTFVSWDAEEAQPYDTFPDFAAAIRSLLTDLYEDEVLEKDRRAIARLLLPMWRRRYALQPEER